MTSFLNTPVLQPVKQIAQQCAEYSSHLQSVQCERDFQPTKEAEYYQQ